MDAKVILELIIVSAAVDRAKTAVLTDESERTVRA